MTISSRAKLAAVSFAIVFPTIVTLIYFVVLANEAPSIQGGAGAFGTVVQFGFPAVWVFLILREKIACPCPTGRGLGVGFCFGLLVATAMWVVALWWLEPVGFFDVPREAIVAKIRGMGLTTTAKYAAVGIFYALCHSLLEEYYWRWFVFRRLKDFVRPATAIAISSLGFMAHHVILLAVFFGWASPATYIFSAGVAIGGVVWAWLYRRSESLYGPWLSHLLVDAAIFTVGYQIAGEIFT